MPPNEHADTEAAPVEAPAFPLLACAPPPPGAVQVPRTQAEALALLALPVLLVGLLGALLMPMPVPVRVAGGTKED